MGLVPDVSQRRFSGLASTRIVMASIHEVPETSWPIFLAQQIENINQRIEQLFGCVRDLNSSHRSQDSELAELRRKLGTLNEEVGFDFQGTRIIPRAAAAKLLHRTPRTLRRWEQTKQLQPLYPSPNQAYYRLADVQALVESFGTARSGRAISGK